MNQLIISVSDNLSSGDQRDFVKNFLSRTKPGYRHLFMRNKQLRDGVEIRREKKRLFVEI